MRKFSVCFIWGFTAALSRVLGTQSVFRENVLSQQLAGDARAQRLEIVESRVTFRCPSLQYHLGLWGKFSLHEMYSIHIH